MRRRRFEPGELRFDEGAAADSQHHVGRGHASVRVSTPRGDQAIWRVLGPDDVVGEMALVSPAPRSATVIAIEPTETMVLDRESFAELRKLHSSVDDFIMSAS